MGKIFYNQLKNSRIKNIALGVILLAINGLMVYIISLRMADGKPTNTFTGLLLCFITIGIVFLFGLIPFGQVIESRGKEFETYYKFGGLKFKQQKWGQADSVSLEQDKEKFYCLKIRTVKGKTFEEEKYATFDVGNIRLNEFKRLFE
jgi:hypothetical protein